MKLFFRREMGCWEISEGLVSFRYNDHLPSNSILLLFYKEVFGVFV